MTKSIYKDKNGDIIKASDYIIHDDGDIEVVIDGENDIGLNASNPNYTGNNITNEKIYPLHEFNLNEWEIVKAFAVCQTPDCQQTYPLQYFGEITKDTKNVKCKKCKGILIDKKGHANFSAHPHVIKVVDMDKLAAQEKEELKRKKEERATLNRQIKELEQNIE